jgi:transcription antitermination factor NusG
VTYSSLPWFALRVRSQCEKAVAHALRERDYEQFLPMYSSRRRWSDRWKTIEVPLFAGYLFCRFEPSHRAKILTTPGVMHIAGIGKAPLAVEVEEIEAIRQAVQSGQCLEPWNRLQVGSQVRIEVGPLKGLQGVLLRFKGTTHLIVNVQLLRRGVAVEVKEEWVAPARINGYIGRASGTDQPYSIETAV